MRIKDRILLGMVSGLIGSIPGRIINKIEYRKGYTDLKYEQSATSLFVPKKYFNTIIGKLIGFVANGTICAGTGVLTAYILSATGRDHAITKGIGINMLFWMSLVGLPAKLGLTVSHKKPIAPLLSLIDHIIFGTSCGYLISKIGDDSLFPDSAAKLRIPLIAKSSPDYAMASNELNYSSSHQSHQGKI